MGGEIGFFLSDPISYLPDPVFSLDPGHLPALLFCLYCHVCDFDQSALPQGSRPTRSLSAVWGHREPATESPVPRLGHTCLPADVAQVSFSVAPLPSTGLYSHTWCAHSLRHMDCCRSPHGSVNGKRGFSASLVHAIFSGLGTIAGTQNTFVLKNVPVEIIQLRCREDKV